MSSFGASAPSRLPARQHAVRTPCSHLASPASRRLTNSPAQAIGRDRQASTSKPRVHLSDGPYDPYNCITAKLSPTSSAPSTGSSGGVRPLSGWDVAIKENICMREGRTTCSSRMLSGYTSTFDAACVQRLRAAGATISARTNCDEFGMGSENVHSFHGPVRNPAKAMHSRSATERPAGTSWDLDEERVAGGSSGGSAAAVKAGLARIALGSDTGGSVRLPAAYCGVLGLKPSYGLISRWGLVSYADSLDTIGVLGTRTDDIETAFDVLSAPDPRDPTCVDAATRTEAAQHVSAVLAASDGVAGLRIGIPQEYFPAELHPRVLPALRQTLQRLQQHGAELVPVSLPTTPLALSAYYIISSAEASSNLARYDGVEYGYRADPPPAAVGSAEIHPYARTRSEAFGAEVQRRILLGTYALSADKFDNYFLQAGRVRRQIQRDFHRVLRMRSVLEPRAAVEGAAQSGEQGVDVLVHPSAVNTAPTLAESLGLTTHDDDHEDQERGGEKRERDRAVRSYVQDVLTVPASLAGLPALSLPVGTAEDDGWPVGVTAVAQWGGEKVLFRIARALSL